MTPLLVAASVFANLHYREIGPAIGGGRTTAIVSSEHDPQRYYVGTADGGVFGSTDGGNTWHPLFDRLPSAAIGALALNPNDPLDVWAGTGEANPRNTVEAGDGVWRTTDGGATWRHIGLARSKYISSILLDPHDSRVALAGVLGDVFAPGGERGVYVTRDGGAHWRRTLAVDATSGISNMARVPDRPQIVFAGAWHVQRTPWTLTSGGTNGGLYRSIDGGFTWKPLRGRGLPEGPTGRIGIATGTHGWVYAIIESREGNVWRSRDEGDTWTKMPRSAMIGARPFYFSRLFVDPADNRRVISVGGRLSISSDGARSFHMLANNTGYDYHDVWWSKDGQRLAAALDGGVILSADGGVSWNQPYTLPIAQLYHIGIDDTLPDYQVCVGLQDNNSWCGVSSSASGVGILNRDWQLVAPGDGMWSLFDPGNRDRVFSTEMNTSTGQLYVTNMQTHQATEISPDAEATLGKPARDLRYRFNWETPIAFINLGSTLLLGGNVVFATSDSGVHWNAISPDLTRNDRAKQGPSGGPITYDMTGAETYDTILDIAMSPVIPSSVWASTDDGLVQLTRDGGATWANVSPSDAPAWSRIDCVEPSSHAAGRAYIALDRHMNGDTHPYIYQTDDYGTHWRKISTGIPDGLFVRVIREDPINSVLFAGTQRGVWFSADDGKHWASLRLNMPASAVYDIAIVPHRHDLVVATYGRGIWILDDMRPVEELPSTTDPVIYLPRVAYRMWQWAPIQSFPGGIQNNVFAGESAPYGALLTFYAPRNVHARVEILKSADRVVRHIDLGEIRAGLHRVSWDLNEDGPTPWTGTYPDNRGPLEGAESLPGSYTVRLYLGKTKLEGPFAVRQDPRDLASIDRYAQRYVTLHTLYEDLDVVDRTLNRVGAAEGKRIGLTSDPQFYEGVTTAPLGVREQIQDLLARLSSAYQAPTPAQLQQVQALDERVKSLTRAASR